MNTIPHPSQQQEWQQFYAAHSAAIFRQAKRKGFQDADANDVTQDVMVSLVRKRGHYDPDKGTVENWVFIVAKNAIVNHAKRRQIQGYGVGPSGESGKQLSELQNDPLLKIAAPEIEQNWDQEYEQNRFLQAAERVQHEFNKRTWKAFWLTAVEGLTARAAGKKLKMSSGAVYVAKSRVVARLREEIGGAV